MRVMFVRITATVNALQFTQPKKEDGVMRIEFDYRDGELESALLVIGYVNADGIDHYWVEPDVVLTECQAYAIEEKLLEAYGD